MKVEIEIPDDLHPDTAALVVGFAQDLAAKLRRSEVKYSFGNGWKTEDWSAELPIRMIEHVMKGDPLDVGAYAAFAWARKWSTAPRPSWRWARWLVGQVFTLCEKDSDVASLVFTRRQGGTIGNAIAVIPNNAKAATRLRDWLIASGYMDPRRLVHPVQNEEAGESGVEG